MGTWPVEIHRRGPAATKPHYEPRGSGGGGGWLGTVQVCTTWRVAAASRPRHKPSRAGEGADWRIPLRIGPALDRRAGGFSPARAPVTDGAERLGDSFRGPVRCAPPDGSPPLPGPVISPRGPGEERTGASPWEPGQRWTAGGFSPARAPVTDGAERLGDLYRGASILAD